MISKAQGFLAAVFFFAALTSACAAKRDTYVLANGQVDLHCSRRSGTCTLHWPDGTELGPVETAVDLADGKRWHASDFPKHQFVGQKGALAVTIRHYGAPDGLELVQHVSLMPKQGYLLMDVEVKSDHAIGTRHISPLVLAGAGGARLVAAGRPSVVFVPFDNDMWVHYNEPIDPAKDPDSYEVTAIYDPVSRKGLVLGSVSHDLWRSGILARKLAEGRVNELEVYGGATGHWSHDVEPHGVVTGRDVKSPTIMVGYFADWRDGMEAYGRENARVKPPLPWKDGVPFGWNSWAAYLQKIDLKKYLANADFLHEELEPKGYENNHTTYVNWDAGWSAVREADLIAAAQHLHGQGQKAGIYFTPFSYWSDDFSKTVEGTDGKYRYSDLLLRDSHGQPLPKVDGAHALDPTHPGTLARIDAQLAQFVAWGYDSVKLDFLNCGSLEGVHFDTKITTGVAAYNLGMQRIEHDLAPDRIGRSFFISLSIAPLFPGYGHSRRVSCDAFGRIEDSEYLLNAVTSGWWSNGTLYQFNDPDHTVISRDLDPYHSQSVPGSEQSLDEARSRVNASVIAGTLLLDSDDLMDPRAQSRAKELLTNAAVLNVARAGRSFRPVEGGSGIHAAPMFEREEKDGSVLVAAFNYSEDKPSQLRVELSRLGLDGGRSYRVTDLWTGSGDEITHSLEIPLGPGQSRLMRLVAK